ncbi:hypothetical protein [Cobetia sp. 5-25-4-2]|uniref:hypothetical protein n=1 Tax=Cobetia sp. 5-25-4-2 TaxID=2737459 RepID=UPI00159714E8|nr:hypothetical protein [Cobetia sp. 5-25-4-2]
MQENLDKAAQKQQRDGRRITRKLKADVRCKDRSFSRNDFVTGGVEKARSLLRRSTEQRGRLTSLNKRIRLLMHFDETVAGGAARYKAAGVVGLSQRTLKRWR